MKTQDDPRRASSLVSLQPPDEHNQRLTGNVHPPQWQNPTPSGRYHLVVIGAGTAGLVAAAGAAGLGAKVALVERALMGGDCLNFGCVPSKALISTARAATAARRAPEFGIRVSGEVQVDFPAIMQRMRRLRADISPNDSAERFRNLGVDVYFGQAEFVDGRTIAVNDTRLAFKHAVIATGGRASAPPIPGLDGIAYLTNETIFSLTELPRRLGVIGAGPIGVELAQAFARFGSEVHLFVGQRGLLPKEDRDAAEIVQRALKRDGIRIHDTARELEVSTASDGIRMLGTGENGHDLSVDRLLVATGRAPNVDGLNLEAAGVRYDDQGVTVTDRLRTTNPRIFAAGDVCSTYQFTHAADFMARIVIQNALFLGRSKASALTIPWCTYTSPEVAHVGISEHEAERSGIAIDTYVQQLTDVDRAILESETDGFAKIHCRKGKDRILGATIVSSHAGELISEVTLAMKNRIGLKQIGSTIHPYPTQAEAIRRLGDQYNRTRLTPGVKSLFKTWLDWTR